jgi:iron complex transport system substrate-binding protein
MRPTTLKEVFDEALRLGRHLDRLDAAMEVLAKGEARLKALRDRIGVDRRTDPASLPSVACVEWLEPLMVAGHWMPDVVEMAGGRAVMAEAGTPTRRVEWAALREADPDVIVCMPCGFTIEETRRDLHYLTERDGWGALSAVRAGRVALLDGNAYYNRPGRRLYRAIAILATVLYPDLTLDPPPAAWERQDLGRRRVPAE